MNRARAALLVVCSWTLFVVLDVAFRLLPFKVVTDMFCRRLPYRRSLDDGEAHAIAEETFRAVLVATRFYYRREKDCLPKAFVLHRLLTLRGVDSCVQLGVKKYPFAGHAWTECHGRVFQSPVERLVDYTLIATH